MGEAFLFYCYRHSYIMAAHVPVPVFRTKLL